MIIFRYLAREVLVSMAAVSGVLLLIIMSGRFVKYLAEAASGRLAAEVLLSIMFYRLPGFLELILPLGLFIGFLLAYGRLYMDSELTVLTACGFSPTQLLRYSFFPAGMVALLVGLLSLLISPIGIREADAILQEQKNRSELEHLVAARFQELRSGGSVVYTERMSADRQTMYDVFIAQRANEQDDISVVVAKTGEQVTDPESGRRYIRLSDGYRYTGLPGQQDYQVVEFEHYWQLLPEPVLLDEQHEESDARTTAALWRSSEPADVAALHWRLSLPIMVVVVTLMAVPLSKTNPRQGRYLQMLPAILLYIIYLVSLNGARGVVEDGGSPWSSMWLVHGLFTAIAIAILSAPHFRRKQRAAKGGR